ncbi:hypothetical protein HPB50_003494 [Hyalomma asiaticum]|uniref:Uncharacterized protein n=1 Tax=Hyalomma asiaticum TaxID=266040 RepID=A0ACB7SJS3_HYAAI|nr:hypothetical protein HPB50_003494 [Hyalomma asiaticum]
MKTTKLQFQLLDPRSSDELGAAAKMTVDDAPTTDSLLAFRRALDAEHATDRSEPTPLLTDRARSGFARNEPRRKTATRNMTKIVSKKMSKKTTSKSLKNKKKKTTRNPTTTPAEGPRKKTVAIKMGKRSTIDHRSGRRVTVADKGPKTNHIISSYRVTISASGSEKLHSKKLIDGEINLLQRGSFREAYVTTHKVERGPCQAKNPLGRGFLDGTCMPLIKCKQTLRGIIRLNFPVICGFELLRPIVCCPNMGHSAHGSGGTGDFRNPLDPYNVLDDIFKNIPGLGPAVGGPHAGAIGPFGPYGVNIPGVNSFEDYMRFLGLPPQRHNFGALPGPYVPTIPHLPPVGSFGNPFNPQGNLPGTRACARSSHRAG